MFTPTLARVLSTWNHFQLFRHSYVKGFTTLPTWTRSLLGTETVSFKFLFLQVNPVLNAQQTLCKCLVPIRKNKQLLIPGNWLSASYFIEPEKVNSSEKGSWNSKGNPADKPGTK